MIQGLYINTFVLRLNTAQFTKDKFIFSKLSYCQSTEDSALVCLAQDLNESGTSNYHKLMK